MKIDNQLEEFYASWSDKTPEQVQFDIKASQRKATEIYNAIPKAVLKDINSVLDFGCGYGAVLASFVELHQSHITSAVGVDFSQPAISRAQKYFNSSNLHFHKLPEFEVAKNSDFFEKIIPNGVDCILLIDLLEHVADSQSMIEALSKYSNTFLIKLPVENSILDNYILPKEYPSTQHSNGHLREFDVNSVFYFIRKLGLTPQFEALYIYDIVDTCPPLSKQASIKQTLVYWSIRLFKQLASYILPKRIFMKLVGGGGYFCVASYNKQHVLNP
jgi:SAM-dependent methyltransferase